MNIKRGENIGWGKIDGGPFVEVDLPPKGQTSGGEGVIIYLLILAFVATVLYVKYFDEIMELVGVL